MLVELTWQTATITVGLFVGSLVLSTLLVGTVLVRLQPDFFVADKRGLSRGLKSHPAELLMLVGKNLLGALLIVTGVVLSLPGVPGQGLLTILAGLFLVDIPAKRKLELRIVRMPRVLHAINKLRDRFGAAPLIVDGRADDPDAAPESSPGAPHAPPSTRGRDDAR